MKKKKRISEALSYTPEKEQGILTQAKKDLEDSRRILESYLNKVKAITLGDFLETPDVIDNLKGKVNQAYKAVGKLEDRYRSVLNMYPNDTEFTDQLDKVTDNIADVTHGLDGLDTVLTEVPEVLERLNRHYYGAQ